MKITPEERMLLQQFSGYVGAALGLPSRTGMESMIYLVDKFIEAFDRNAERERRVIALEVSRGGH